MLQVQQKVKQGVNFSVLEHLDIPVQVYDKTGRATKEDVVKISQVKTVASEVELAERIAMMTSRTGQYEILDKETALRHIKVLELSKVQQISGALIATQMGRLPQNRIPMVKEVAKIQSFDAYNKESGIEDSDIVIAIHKHQLLESPEFEEIMREVQQQIQSSVQQTM